MFKRVIAMLAVIAMLSGCNGDIDFWGNPVPEPTPEVNATCALPDGTAEKRPYDPTSTERPPDITPGNSWLTVSVEVRALGPEADLNGNEFCMPILVTAYSEGLDADTITINRVGLPAHPHMFITTTPFVNQVLALQYDPTEERFAGRPPTYHFDLDAVYLEGRDVANADKPMAMRCAFRIGGATIVSNLALIPQSNAVFCELTGNDLWRPY